MTTKRECRDCEEYRKQGHNYCRVCGYHLTKGLVQFVRLAHAYFTHEKLNLGHDRHHLQCGCFGLTPNNRNGTAWVDAALAAIRQSRSRSATGIPRHP